MAKTIEEVKAALEAAKAGDIMNDVIALIEAEKHTGIEASNKKGRENANLRKYKLAMEALGYSDDEDLEDYTSKLIEKTTKATINDDGRVTTKALQEQIKSLTKAIETERNRSSEAEKKATQKTIIAKLSKEINERFYAPDLLIQSLINEKKVSLDVDDNVIFTDGDNTIPCQDGIKKLMETRRDIVKNNQIGGAGTKPSNSIPDNIADVMKSGNKELIKQNLDDIKKSMGF